MEDNDYNDDLFFQFKFDEDWGWSGNSWQIWNHNEAPKQVPLDDVGEVFNQGDLITDLEFKKMMGEL